jgi:NADH:ubiquinone oxidoreductase subunit D
VCSKLWQEFPEAWILPSVGSRETARVSPTSHEPLRVGETLAVSLSALFHNTDALRKYVERNRSFALRTRNIGIITSAQLKQHGIESGSVYKATTHGRGDVQTRLVTRLQETTDDLQSANDIIATMFVQSRETRETFAVSQERDDIPEGEATARVLGPRGYIELHLTHSSTQAHDNRLSQVEWRSPSAPLVALLPDLLVGQKLADAEVILASLDIGMAEVDG